MAGPGKLRSWVVEPQGPHTLGTLLERMQADAQALGDGRVFVDRKRVTEPAVELVPGQLVQVYGPARDIGSQVVVLGEREGIVAIHKPASLPTIPDQRGLAASAQALVAQHLGVPIARVHPTSRLDVGVSGVVLFATDEHARVALSQARERGDYVRHYLAISHAVPKTPAGRIDVPIGRGKGKERAVRGRDCVACVTDYRVAAKANGALISAEPQTGRTHQIRVHLAHVGAPLVGDRLYGGKQALTLASGAVHTLHRIALHAAWVSVRLQPKAQPWAVEAAIPDELLALWDRLEGRSADWQQALRALSAEQGAA